MIVAVLEAHDEYPKTWSNSADSSTAHAGFRPAGGEFLQQRRTANLDRTRRRGHGRWWRCHRYWRVRPVLA